LRLFLRILLYVSLGFLGIYLYSKGLLVVPHLHKTIVFVMSIFVVLIGFFVDAKAWQIIVKTELPKLKYKDALISAGKFIFSKYIPGKLWVVVGRAGYLKEKYKSGFINLTSFSFYYQLISIFSGTLVGIAILYFIDVNWFLVIGIGMLLFIIFISFGFKPAISKASRLISFVFRKEIKLPYISSKVTIQVCLISIVNWLIWSSAFYLFLLSVHSVNFISIKAGLLFPLSSVVGIIVIIAPGGLGFREGFLTFGLIALGVTAKDAASVAVLSRLWFLLGEFAFFATALLFQLQNKNKLK